MKYEVESYCDQIKQRNAAYLRKLEKLRANNCFWASKKRLLFDTEEQAKTYIIQRADDGVEEAEKALKKAQARLAKCLKKFGTGEGTPLEEIRKELGHV